MVKIGYLTHKNKRKQMKINENEKMPILHEILGVCGLIVMLVVLCIIIRDYYQLAMYPRYTITYVDRHDDHNRGTYLFFYANGIRYDVYRTNTLFRPDTRYYIKFSSKNPDINKVRDRVPDFIHNPPTDGW